MLKNKIRPQPWSAQVTIGGSARMRDRAGEETLFAVALNKVHGPLHGRDDATPRCVSLFDDPERMATPRFARPPTGRRVAIGVEALIFRSA
jgi:hypothetical protein